MAWIEAGNKTKSVWRKIVDVGKKVLAGMGGLLVIVNFGKLLISPDVVPVLTAVWNNSGNLLQKLVDFKYAFAAQYNLMDLFVLPAVALLWGMLAFGCYGLIGCNKTAQERHDDMSPVDYSRKTGSSRGPFHRKMQCVVTWLVVGFAIYLVCATSLMVDCYFRLCNFQRACASVRPYISDNEHYALNRKWVTMTSKADYMEIERDFERYRKRIEMYSNIRNGDAIVGGRVMVGGGQ